MSLRYYYERVLKFFGYEFVDEHLLNTIVNGDYWREFVWSPFNAKSDEFLRILSNQKRFVAARNNLERIHLMRELLPLELLFPLLEELDKKFNKGTKEYQWFLQKGKKHAPTSNKELALRCFNLATLFAPVEDGSLGKSFAMRASYFYSIGEAKLCFDDLQLAREYNCPMDAYEQTMPVAVAKFSSSVLPTALRSCIEMKNFRDKVMSKVFGGVNPKIPSASKHIEVQFSERKGRIIIANAEIPPGTTIIVEDPILKALKNSLKWDTTRCANCLKLLTRIIPCLKCVFVSYCSLECRAKDLAQGHGYECPCFPYLHTSHVSGSLHLAMKALCKEGPQNLYKRFITPFKPAKEGQIQGFNPETGSYDSDSFYQLNNLKAYYEEDQTILVAWAAASIVELLDKKTTFFKIAKRREREDFKDFVASIFLQYGTSFPYNAVGIFGKVVDELTSEASEECRRAPLVESAVGIYNVTTLISHSCDPSAFRLTLPDGRLVVITNRRINPGEEIDLSYGTSYATDELERRLNIHKVNYHFNCRCVACILKWPTLGNICADRIYLCPVCGGHYNDSPLIQVRRCALEMKEGETSGFCKNCNETIEMRPILTAGYEFGRSLILVEKLLDRGRCMEALPLIIECCKFAQDRLCAPSKHLIISRVFLNETFYSILDGANQVCKDYKQQ